MEKVIKGDVFIETEKAESGTVWFSVLVGDELVETYRDPRAAGELAWRLMRASRSGHLQEMVEAHYKAIGD